MIRLPASPYGGSNVATTRNMTEYESLPSEAAAADTSAQTQDLTDVLQDDSLLSSTHQGNTAASNVAAPYEEYIDDGSVTTCPELFAKNQMRKVQIDFQCVQIDFQHWNADNEKCTDIDSQNHLKLPLGFPDQELWISIPQEKEKDDTHDSEGSVTIVDSHDLLDLKSSVPMKSETDDANGIGGSTYTRT